MIGRGEVGRVLAAAVVLVLGLAGCGATQIIDVHHHVAVPCWPTPHDSVWADRNDAVKWNPEGSKIYFSQRYFSPGMGESRAALDEGVDIYSAAADGSRLVRVARTSSPWERSEPAPAEGELGPAWMTAFDVSPDGRHIVYSRCTSLARPGADGRPAEHDYGYELALADSDGEYDVRLTTNGRFDNFPTWSPDGRRIAYYSGAFLHTMAIDGTDVWVIHGGPVNDPDRRAITAGPVDDSAARFARRSPIQRGAVAPQPPQWAPDGRRLAFVGTEPRMQGAPRNPTYSIYTVGADGSGGQRLTEAVSGPSWSPDGERLAFAKLDGAEVALYTIAVDGSDARRVTTIEGWRARQYGEPDPTRAWIDTVAWSPAGGQILYTCGRAVCVVDLDGTPVGASPSDVTDGSAAAWSPDGSRIAIASSRARQGDAVLRTMTPDGTDLRILVRHDADAGLQAVGARRPAGPVEVAGCAAGAAVPNPAAHPGLVQDCKTLLEMRDVLAGGAELDWSADRPMTEWDGVELGGAPLRVSGMRLALHGLSGVIPSELGRLTQLRALDLRANQLDGVIPAELGGLTQLSTLLLESNQLQGIIPPELGQLANLEELDLAVNQLTRAIPAELGQLANLKLLKVGDNQLTGTVPAELGQLAKLEGLSLHPNPLTGCIAPALKALPGSRDLGSLGLPDCE